jgi:hypothetical protein
LINPTQGESNAHAAFFRPFAACGTMRPTTADFFARFFAGFFVFAAVFTAFPARATFAALLPDASFERLPALPFFF